MTQEKMMSVEEATALRMANESALIDSIAPLMQGYAAEEIVGALLSLCVQTAMQTNSNCFKSEFRIHDRLSVAAEFTVHPINQAEADALIEEAKEKGLL